MVAPLRVHARAEEVAAGAVRMQVRISGSLSDAGPKTSTMIESISVESAYAGLGPVQCDDESVSALLMRASGLFSDSLTGTCLPASLPQIVRKMYTF